jgi:ligand-binding sensor domain-containing protein
MVYPENGEPLPVSMPGELTWTAPSALMIDNQDRLWVGTENGMVGMRDANDEWTIYTSNPDFSVWEMVMDAQGRVWARSHRGPGRIDPAAGERTFSFMNSGLVDNDAVAITVDEQGQLWVLTSKRELKVLEANGSWRTYTVTPNTVRNSIYGSHMAFDSQGQIWLATSDGVGVLSTDGTWTSYPLGDGRRPLDMTAIIPDANGRLWVAASLHGVFMFDPKTGWTNYTGRNSGLRGDANALAFDERGQVWVGSSQGGLHAFQPEAALSDQSLSTIRLAIETIVPAAILFTALLGLLKIAFDRPGVVNRKVIAAFSLAFAGWFLLNSLLWIYVRYSYEQSSSVLFINPLILLPLPVNILALILLYRANRWTALGALTAFLVNWLVLVIVTPFVDPSGAASILQGIFMIPFFLPG